MNCPKCATYNPEDACFCRHCGRKLSESETDKFSASINILKNKLALSNDYCNKLKRILASQTETIKSQNIKLNEINSKFEVLKSALLCLLDLSVLLVILTLSVNYYIQLNNYIQRNVYLDCKSGALNIIDSKYDSPLYTLQLVERGSFIMGETSEMLYSRGASPSHKVSLTKDYYVGETEVTNLLWDWVMNDTINTSDNASFPKNLVSWTECNQFINKLNKKTDNAFRLPTEAEWEYAARGGKLSKPYTFSGSCDFNDVAWFAQNSEHRLHMVKSLSPNPLGLYDMSGNLWEWCSDIYDEYQIEDKRDPIGANIGDLHVIRGGGYENYPECDISFRVGYTNKRLPTVGFRIVLTKE